MTMRFSFTSSRSKRWLGSTGADRTVISWGVLQFLSLPPLVSQERIGGVGGMVDSVVIDTTIQLFRDLGGEVTFRSHFAAVTDPASLDISVLGRDITSLFAVMVDRPGDVVCLVRPRHRYVVIED
jgi:hypothetical protein